MQTSEQLNQLQTNFMERGTMHHIERQLLNYRQSRIITCNLTWFSPSNMLFGVQLKGRIINPQLKQESE